MSGQARKCVAPTLSPADVAAQFNLKIRHVYRLINRRRDPLPAHKIGTYWRVDSDELFAWWQRQAKGGRHG